MGPPTGPPFGAPSTGRRRVWPFVVAAGVLVVLLISALTVVLVTSGGGSAADYVVDQAAVSEDAELAWTEKAPEDLVLQYARSITDDGVLAIYRPDESGPEFEMVAYDRDGEKLWHEDDIVWGQASNDGTIVFAYRDDEVSALEASTGDELWSIDGSTYYLAERGDRVIGDISPPDDSEDSEDSEDTSDDSEPHHTVVLDTESGDEVASIEGEMLGHPGDELFVTRDGQRVRAVDLDGEEQWTADLDDLDLDAEEDDTAYAAVSDDVVVLATETDEDSRDLVGLDPGTGEKLWEESGNYDLLARGPEGAAAALKWPDDHDRYDYSPDSGEVVLFDGDGQQDSVKVDELSPHVFGFIEAGNSGDRLVSYESGVVLDSDLTTIADDDPISGPCADGFYVLDGKELSLRSWDSGEEEYAIEVEHDGRAYALDGAVAVADKDGQEFGVYR